MALSFSAAKTNIKRHFYKVYMRENGTAVVAGDYDTLAHWNTFLALFTYIGYCENKNVKLTVAADDPVEIDGGEVYHLGYKGNTELKFLQSAVADDTALTDMAAKDCDLLLVDTTNNKFHYVHDKLFNIEKVINSGEVEHAFIRHEQNCSAFDDYLNTTGAIPTS
jgi:hypothetical protein